MRIASLTAVLALILIPARAQETANWPQWRGPFFNGSSPARNLPDKIAAGDALWSTPIPGHSNGTPIVLGDRIFTTAAQSDGKLLALCLNKSDGKIRWQKEAATAVSHNNRNDFATPSPVTDGKKVIFLYGSGHLVAYDLDGNELWRRELQKELGRWNILWIYGSSPLLFRDKLYVQVLHRNVESKGLDAARDGDSLTDSYLLAINPETGKDIWKVIRPSDAVAESRESYGTPIPWEKPGRTEILLTGGDCITGHDPETGKEYWRAGGWNPQKITHWRLVPSAVTYMGLAIVCPPKGGQILAWKEGGTGDVTSTGLAWKGNNLTSDVCVPLMYQRKMYVLDGDKKQLICVDPMTGERKWAGTLDSKSVLRTSPTGADGKIYCMNEAGDLFVCSADKFEVLSKASLGDGNSRGSIAAVDGMIIVRTGEKVWAFAGKK
jgi:outer membrane protein assembly factor BamB